MPHQFADYSGGYGAYYCRVCGGESTAIHFNSNPPCPGRQVKWCNIWDREDARKVCVFTADDSAAMYAHYLATHKEA